MCIETKEDILKTIAYGARYLNSLFPIDCLIGVTDGKKFIAVYPGKTVDLGIKPGDPVSNEGIVPEVMQSGKVASAELPAQAYGFPIKTTSVPIKDNNGTVIGTIDIGFDLTTQNELIEIAKQVAALTQQVSSSCQNLRQAMETLHQSQVELTELSQKTKAYLKKTDGILTLIDKVASQTNLLGINAAVEAARTGEKGKGFAVVAKGIRELSERATNSTKEVNDILKEIDKFFKKISDYIEETEETGTALSYAIDEIAANMEENAAVTEKLTTISKLL